MKKFLFSTIAAGAIAVASLTDARSATIVVTTASDELNSDGDCALREAIRASNTGTAVDACTAGTGTDTIVMPAGTFTLAIAGRAEDAGMTGDLDISTNQIINGAGAGITILDGGGIDRVLEVRPGATVAINGVTIRNGNPGAGAGGVVNRGTLTLTASIVSGNTGVDFGGGVYNDLAGTLALTDTTVSGNILLGANNTGGGGGIFSQGTMTAARSTFSGNTTIGRGGAIYNLDKAMTLTNCTISGNLGLNGGGIFNRDGTVQLTSCTTSGNTATGEAGGIWRWGGTATLASNIFSGNSPTDCTDVIASSGYNLASDNSCNFSAIGDLNGTEPLLDPLAGNGGPTKTHALLAGSPAIDAVPVVACSTSADQRSVPRPDGSACDIGAYEGTLFPPPCQHDAGCDDGNLCTFDACNVGTGICSHSPVICSDVDPCTAEFCDPAGGCAFTISPVCATKSHARCTEKAISAAAKFATAKMKALARCEDAKVVAKLSPDVTCALEDTVLDTTASAEAKFKTTIAKSCPNPSELGWPTLCPDFAGSGCGSIALADANGLSSCLSCIQEQGVEEAVTLYYGHRAPSVPGSKLHACQRAIGKLTSRYFSRRAKAVSKCLLGYVSGAHSSECPLPGDSKTRLAISKMEAKQLADLTRVCAEFTPEEVGFPTLCPATGSCGETIHTMMDLMTCLDCVTDFSSLCLMGAAALPRVEYPEICELAPGLCDDGLDCTLDAGVEYTEELETSHVCFGGSKDGRACATNVDCPGGPCQAATGFHYECDGDPDENGLFHTPCSSDADCPLGSCIPQAVVLPVLPVEQGCVHTPLSGPEFGYWLHECVGGSTPSSRCSTNTDCGTGTCMNVSPCCESDSDCRSTDPCQRGECAVATHRCIFESLHPSDCGSNVHLPTEMPPTPEPCVEPALAGVLCNLDATIVPDPPPILSDHLRFDGPAVRFADLHVHMFAEESWHATSMSVDARAKSSFLTDWRWVHGSTGATAASCDGGLKRDHGRINSIRPIANKFESCAVDFAHNSFGAWIALGLAAPEWANDKGALLMSQKMSATEGTAGDAAEHASRREPGTGWPRWDTVAHHKFQPDSLVRASNDGLKLMVVMLTGTRALCELLPPNGVFPPESCDEMKAIQIQIKAAEEFDKAHSEVKLVFTPEQAESVVAKNQMAMVLSIETTELFRNLESKIRTNSWDMEDAIKDELKQYYRLGVRSMHIVHMTDSLFAGCAAADDVSGLLQFMYEPYEGAGRSSCQVETFTENSSDVRKFGQQFDQVSLGFADIGNGPFETFIYKNKQGLRPAGEILVREMMRLGMLIDLSHASEKTIQRVWEIAYEGLPASNTTGEGDPNGGPYYPFHFSHTRFREIVKPSDVNEYVIPAWVVQRVRRVGGMVGLRTNSEEMRTYTRESSEDPFVANTCAGSSRSFAQPYRYAAEGLKVPVALGTDLQTFSQFTRPRFRSSLLPGSEPMNPNGACGAGFLAEGVCQSHAQTDRLNENFDTIGLASAAEEGALLRDMKKIGVDVSKLAKSADDYIRMWKRARSVRHGPAAKANLGIGPDDMDLRFIGDYEPIAKRMSDYPLECTTRYCPHTLGIGEACRVDAECIAPMACGTNTPCGLTYGVCVCTISGGCGSNDWCKLGLPGKLADNKCEPKKGRWKPCHADRQCINGTCSWFTCN